MLDKLQNAFSEINISMRSISGVGFNDILDILIISYLVYKLLIWIKQTRTWSLLKGFVVILAISVFSYAFNLHTVWWLIENTFSVGLIALFVLFQPEIRKALEKIGKSSFSISDHDGAAIGKNAIDEIITAVEDMSSVRTGALILIEQEGSLDDFAQTGIPIGAVISSQLLVNIFEDKTPLHDGAVIIQNNRIAAACCILPLTQDEIGKELGTRHRAAVGVSELSDAIVLVVSEETGGISIAQGGELRRRLSEEQIREILGEYDQEEKKKLFSWKGLHKNGKDT